MQKNVSWVGVADGTKLSSLSLPFYLSRITAGFPSPAQDYVERQLDLNELCIKHPSATFFVQVEGDSMCEAGIYAGDILVVDRSLQARHGDIVVAYLLGEFTVKQLQLRPVIQLLARNKNYPPIEITEESQLDIFGVVASVVRQLR